MRQSRRIALFAAAFLGFLICTYLAFFRVSIGAEAGPRPGFFTLAWWLRPIEFNPASRLHYVDPEVNFACISGLENGGEIWVGGSKGLLIHSTDGGDTWKQLPTITAPPFAGPSSERPPQKGASLRRSGEWTNEGIMRVAMQENPPAPDPRQQQQQFVPYPTQSLPPNAPAQVPNMPNQAPTPFYPPAESLPPVPQALLSNDLIDLQFVNARLGHAVMNWGEILASNDGGRSWRILRLVNPTIGYPVRVRFADESRGVMIGQFGVSNTNDGGETWSAPSRADSQITDIALTKELDGHAVGLFPDIVRVEFSVVDFTVRVVSRSEVAGLKIRPFQFTRIARASPQSLFACGWEGVIVRSSDNGISWQATETGVPVMLHGIFFASPQLGWAVGEDGAVVATRDGGASWQTQKSGSIAPLTDVYFASPSRGFIAGRNGTLLGTENGGASWRSLVTTTANRPGSHAWLPAPWYYLSLLLLFGLVRRIPEEIAPAPRQGIGEILVSDKPIEAGDPDYLGFRQVAWGLSNYLRNKATKPPLTIAITGEWGMGKSSLMNLVHADLRHYKFRPVWFNAWHHQTEEHLLAALLENIRSQGIPSLRSAEGIVFHAKLLWMRARRHLVATLFVIAAICFCGAYFAADPERLLQSPDTVLKALKNPLDTLIQRTGAAGQALVVLVAVGGALLGFFKALRPFGVDPAKLLASRSRSARASDLRAQTSFRYRFANEFREVTESLNPLSMVLFVDDLDRCRPEQVYDMLEAINFLTSCGDCFVIMGLARRRVERCIGLVFDRVAAEAPDEIAGRALTRADKRRRFARQYLEKLINIEVPVPKGAMEQIRTLLIRKEAEPAERGRFEVLGEKLNDALPHLVPATVCLFVAIFAIWASVRIFTPSPDAFEGRTESKSAVAQAQPQSPGSASSPSDLPSQPTPPPQIGSAKFIPGKTGGVPLWIIALVTIGILTPGIVRLSRRSGSVIEDSPAFLKGLEDWFPFLATDTEMTPRAVKRFVNRVRYFAMMEGSFRPAARWWERLARFLQASPAPVETPPAAQTDEELLVALATIHERHPEWFAGDLASFSEGVRKFPAEEKKNLPPEAALAEIDEATYEHFKKLVAGVEVR